MALAGCPTPGAEGQPCLEPGDWCDDDLLCVDGTCVVGSGGEGEGVGEGEGEGVAEGEGEGEQFCASGGIVCDSDRVCAGGFCDKENDGDGVPAIDDPLGCCVVLVCQSDADCDGSGGETCDVFRGLCVAPSCDSTSVEASETTCVDTSLQCVFINDDVSVCIGANTAAGACEYTGSGAVVVEGAHIPLTAVALEGGRPAVWLQQFSFSVDTGALDADGVFTGCAGPAACTVNVTARVLSLGGSPLPDDVTCSGAITVLPAPVAGHTRVALRDARTRGPVAAAVVTAAPAVGGFVAASTDASGVADFAFDAAVVTATPAAHDWATVIDPPSDVVLYVRRTPDPQLVDGVRGVVDDSRVHVFGDIGMALAGLPVPSVVNLDLERLLGDVADSNVSLEGVTDPGGQLVPFPSTEQLTLGADAIKGDFVAIGDAGTEQLLWSIATKMALADIGPIIANAAGGGDVAPLGFFLVPALPFFDSAEHGIDVVDVNGGLRPAHNPDGSAPPSDAWPFNVVAPTPDIFAHQARFLTTPPPSSPFPTVVLAAVAHVEGRGFIPLGATSFDAEQSTFPIVLGYAPPHDGLEGSKVSMVAASFDPASIVDARGQNVDVAANFEAITDAGAELPALDAFLAFVEGTFDGAAFASTNDAGADFYRVQMDGADGRWIVYASATPSFDVADLTDVDVALVAARSFTARAEALTLTTDATFATLLSADGADVRDIDAVVARISSTSCRPGGPACTAP